MVLWKRVRHINLSLPEELLGFGDSFGFGCG